MPYQDEPPEPEPEPEQVVAEVHAPAESAYPTPFVIEDIHDSPNQRRRSRDSSGFGAVSPGFGKKPPTPLEDRKIEITTPIKSSSSKQSLQGKPESHPG